MAEVKSTTRQLGNNTYLVRQNKTYILKLALSLDDISFSIKDVSNSLNYIGVKSLEQIKTYKLFLNATSLPEVVQVIEKCLADDSIYINELDSSINLCIGKDDFRFIINLTKSKGIVNSYIKHGVAKYFEIITSLTMIAALLIFLNSYKTDQAQYLYHEGNYEEALSVLGDRTDVNSLYFKGLSMYKLERYYEALNVFINLNSLKVDYFNTIEYIKLCKQMMEERAIGEINIGIELRKAQHYNLAIVSFDKAIKIYPKFADAYYNKGIALLYLGETDYAIRLFNIALKYDPTHGFARQILINVMNFLPTWVSGFIPVSYVDYIIDSNPRLT
jgi:tetratricopeptide (TPR) repeat protein